MGLPLIPRRAFLTSALPALAGTLLGADEEERPAPLGISLQQEPLAYELDALEPYLDATTLKLHYHEYHARHVADLRRTLDEVELSVGSVSSLMPCIQSMKRPPQVRHSILKLSIGQNRPTTGVQSVLPEEVQKSIRHNGGAHVNHTAFWRFMAPPGDTPLGPQGRAAAAIDDAFGTLQEFKAAFAAAATKHAGSGWAWLVYRSDKKLVITTTPNEDNPLMREFVDWRDHGLPILALDLWEHSYYRKFKNNRRAYLDAWWKVVNWEFVNKAHAIVRGMYNHS